MQHRSSPPSVPTTRVPPIPAAEPEPAPAPVDATAEASSAAPIDEPEPAPSRRTFLRGSLLGAGALGALGAVSAPDLARAQVGASKSTVNHYHLPASDKTVH